MAETAKKLTTKQEYEELGRMVATINESGFLDIKKSYKNSFIKGFLGGAGGVLGATIGVALLLWVLSWFSSVPLIGRFLDNVQDTVQSGQK
jgi:uncharacterized protein YbgA (DUF1722 family)